MKIYFGTLMSLENEPIFQERLPTLSQCLASRLTWDFEPLDTETHPSGCMKIPKTFLNYIDSSVQCQQKLLGVYCNTQVGIS